MRNATGTKEAFHAQWSRPIVILKNKCKISKERQWQLDTKIAGIFWLHFYQY